MVVEHETTTGYSSHIDVTYRCHSTRMEAHLDGGQHRYSDLPQKMWDVVILPVAEVGIHEIHVLCQRVHCWINLPGEGDSESVGED